ncbi:hypothetical protein QKC54_gp0237 [Megavirus baoshan]|uniref:Uncharacterized protein n=1 Tax=Megavirus baoshan TaxID=2496520 RepID=A0A3Q8U8W7_9VIRU|nr:hypothetical protein QKC54_gp0237 [Megavirus baoshan]AZL89972.1 hypothetical protein Mb0835 [Megavirus baoshan]
MSLIFQSVNEKKTLFSILNNSNKTTKETVINTELIKPKPIVIPENINKNVNDDNDRNIIVTSKKHLTGHDKNSLAFSVDIIKREVINRLITQYKNIDQHDTNLMNIIQSNFQTKQTDWNSMMEYILKQSILIDDKYMLHNHLGLKDNIREQIINFAFSYIIYNDNQPMINQIWNSYISPKFDNELSMKQKIMKYFKIINESMNIIHQSRVRLSRLNLQYVKHENNKKEYLEKIKIIEKDKNLKNREQLLGFKQQIEQCDKMISVIIKDRENYNEIILDNIYLINNTIDFNYFTSNYWIPSLDSNILSTNKISIHA